MNVAPSSGSVVSGNTVTGGTCTYMAAGDLPQKYCILRAIASGCGIFGFSTVSIVASTISGPAVEVPALGAWRLGLLAALVAGAGFLRRRPS